MIHAHDAIREHLLSAIMPPAPHPSLEELRESEWCPEFERLMRNRIIMGSFRYGLIAEQDYDKYDLVAEISVRAERYRRTRNLEHLVDSANIAMLAFVHGRRQGHQMTATDDGPHTPRKK